VRINPQDMIEVIQGLAKVPVLQAYIPLLIQPDCFIGGKCVSGCGSLCQRYVAAFIIAQFVFKNGYKL
jgi:hypothetical protein